MSKGVQLDLFANMAEITEIAPAPGPAPVAVAPAGPPSPPAAPASPQPLEGEGMGAQPAPSPAPEAPTDPADPFGYGDTFGIELSRSDGPVRLCLQAAEAASACLGWGRGWSTLLTLWWASLERLGPKWEENEAVYMAALKGLDKRAVEAAKAAFSAMVLHFHFHGMYADVLGPAHMEVTSQARKGHMGQFFTPWELCVLMARMTGAPEAPTNGGEPWSLNDPAVGAGATLLAGKGVFAAKHGRIAASMLHITGQDIDADCCLMARIQLRMTDPLHMHALVATADLHPKVARMVVEDAAERGVDVLEAADAYRAAVKLAELFGFSHEAGEAA